MLKIEDRKRKGKRTKHTAQTDPKCTGTAQPSPALVVPYLYPLPHVTTPEHGVRVPSALQTTARCYRTAGLDKKVAATARTNPCPHSFLPRAAIVPSQNVVAMATLACMLPAVPAGKEPCP